MSAATDREESLFDAARSFTDLARRRAFLAEACAGDSALRAKIEELLKVCERADDFFEEAAPVPGLVPKLVGPDDAGAPAETGGATRALEDKVSTRIGPYKLLQKIGEGGCGIVYMAEQEKAVRRR